MPLRYFNPGYLGKSVAPEDITALEKIAEGLDAPWVQRYKAFLVYAKEWAASVTRSANVKPPSRPLSRWAKEQRAAYELGTLPDIMRDLLQLVPGWTWSEGSLRWQRGMIAMRAFVSREQHTEVPRRHIEKGYALGSWVDAQRRRHANGDLSPQEIEAMESIPGWVWRARTDPWRLIIEGLTAYVAEHGHARVPQSYRSAVGTPALGKAVADLRNRYHKRKLTADQVSDLERFNGWIWTERDGRWQDHFECLQKFSDEHRHTRVPRSDPRYKALAAWITRQRSECRNGTLSAGRCALLESLPDWQWEGKRGLSRI